MYSSDLFVVWRCPYCPGRRGAVALDAHGLVTSDPETGAAGAGPEWFLDLDLADAAQHGLVVFEPNLATGGPCPHLVACWLEAVALPAAGGAPYPESDPPDRASQRRELAADWEHPWFGENDPAGDLRIHLWEHLATGAGRDAWYRPDPPHVIWRIEEVLRPASARTWEVRVVGWFVASIDAAAFLTALRGSSQSLSTFRASGREAEG